MAQPKLLKKSVSILSIFLYSGDVGSDFWVGIDLILRCHYKFAAAVFSWLLAPGFIQGWVDIIAENEKGLLKALLFPLLYIPYTFWKLIKSAISVFNDENDDDVIGNAKL